MQLSKPRKSATKTTAGRKQRTTARSPLNGAEIPLGSHARNTGGKPGRSGRPPNKLRELLRGTLDDGVSLVHDVILGRATITFSAVCEHCGKTSKGPTKLDDVLALAPTIENRLRAVDIAAKYGLGERSEFSEDVVVENVDKMLAAAEALMSDVDYKAFCRHADTIWNPRGSGRNR